MRQSRLSILSIVFFAFALLISLAKRIIGTDPEFETYRIVSFFLGFLCIMIEAQLRSDRKELLHLMQRGQPGGPADVHTGKPGPCERR